MNPHDDLNERLIDALLKEQSRQADDDAFLAAVAQRMDAAPQPAAARRGGRWRRRVLPLTSVAAVIAAGFFVAHSAMKFQKRPAREAPDLAATAPMVSYSAPREGNHAAEADRERYGRLSDPPWHSPERTPLSTFSIDVDTASYANVRRMITDGAAVPEDAVRIEEFINYFDYGYQPPADSSPFSVRTTLAVCPWDPDHLLARITLKGREVAAADRPASNLVFLVDVSGSMSGSLSHLKDALALALESLDARDRLAIIAYAGSEGVVLEPTALDDAGKSRAREALARLESGGPTNGGAGIRRAYEMAAAHRVPGGVNRVVLATDGDFNVGVTGDGELVERVKQGAADGVDLTVLGFGRGNLNDSMMEAITNEGNGNYYYIDSSIEARRVLLQKLTGTLVTIASDVKIQVEFNPARVQAYRLIGYANRLLRDEDFRNDKVDAGDIGAGHTVTAFYEIVPPGVEMPQVGTVDPLKYSTRGEAAESPADEWFTAKLRYKQPGESESRQLEVAVDAEPLSWAEADDDFRFASAVALFGMKLRQMPEVMASPWQRVVAMAKSAADGEERQEFIELVARHGRFDPGAVVAEEGRHAAELGQRGDEVEPSKVDDLRFMRWESTLWYVQFGLESQGNWAPRFVGLTPDRTRLQNRVSATEMLKPGDVFFTNGPMAGRFKYLRLEERVVTGERSGLTQRTKVAVYEDLWTGLIRESQAGLPEAELERKAHHDRSAVLQHGGLEFTVREGVEFTLPGEQETGKYLLLKVDEDRVQVQSTGRDGAKTVREIMK